MLLDAVETVENLQKQTVIGGVDSVITRQWPVVVTSCR